MIRCTMELGGHSPVMVFKDADIDAAAQLCAMGKFRNAGQVCISPTRFFIEEPVRDQFLAAFRNMSRRQYRNALMRCYNGRLLPNVD